MRSMSSWFVETLTFQSTSLPYFIFVTLNKIEFSGYTGNGHYCKDVNECETNNGGCSMLPFVQCINTRVN